ncbi:hypothetical protein [Paenibacillus xanthanilyticus]|uniref:Transposase n=1 Tax=Paenibacillus xanthanilyticus TaxID=1783531 RepID=A0ABV8K8H3_9BACL
MAIPTQDKQMQVKPVLDAYAERYEIDLICRRLGGMNGYHDAE